MVHSVSLVQLWCQIPQIRLNTIFAIIFAHEHEGFSGVLQGLCRVVLLGCVGVVTCTSYCILMQVTEGPGGGFCNGSPYWAPIWVVVAGSCFGDLNIPTCYDLAGPGVLDKWARGHAISTAIPRAGFGMIA